MDIDKVGEKVLEKKKGIEEKGKKKIKLKENYKESKKVAKGFEGKDNCSSAYFEYFQAAKALGKIYIESILEGSDMGGIDALKFIADKGRFETNKEEFRYLLKRFDNFLMRSEIEKEDVKRLKEFMKKIEAGLKEKSLVQSSS